MISEAKIRERLETIEAEIDRMAEANETSTVPRVELSAARDALRFVLGETEPKGAAVWQVFVRNVWFCDLAMPADPSEPPRWQPGGVTEPDWRTLASPASLHDAASSAMIAAMGGDRASAALIDADILRSRIRIVEDEDADSRRCFDGWGVPAPRPPGI